MTDDPLNTQHSTRPFEKLSLSANKRPEFLHEFFLATFPYKDENKDKDKDKQ